MADNITTVKPPRNSNLELFRIVLMLAIIAHHYVVNSGLLLPVGQHAEMYPHAFKSLSVEIFGAWGKTGINCFLMITGYFMCKSRITVEKFLKLVSEFYFYKIVIGIIFLAVGYVPLSMGSIVDIFIPLKGLSHGFAVSFLFFYLCIPFLNIMLNHIDRIRHLGLLILLLSLYTVIPSVRAVWGIEFNYVTWFSVVYILSAYIRIYPGKWSEGALKWGIISLAAIFAGVVSVYARSYFYLSDSNKILAVASAVSLFLFFKNLRMSYHPWINWTAQSIFGVLLIHANSDAMRQWLWRDTLHVADMFDSPYFWLHAVSSVLGVFVVCTLIDHLRIRFVEKPFLRYFAPAISRAESFLFTEYSNEK